MDAIPENPTGCADPGTALLLACLRLESAAAKAERLNGFDEAAWRALPAAAKRQSATPIVYHTLKTLLPGLAIPGDIFVQMRDVYLMSAGRNMRLYSRLLSVVAEFNAAGISVILLKGAHLAESIYGNPALRPMADVDLLAHRDQLEQVHGILLAQGYHASGESVACADEHLAPYMKKGAQQIEVHHHIAAQPFSRRFDPGELWDRARRETFQGVEVLTLCPEDLLLHLCLHVCIHHAFDNGLMPCLDVCRTIARYEAELDWKRLWRRAERWGAERCVRLTLGLAERLLGLPLPDPVRAILDEDREMIDAVDAAEVLVFERGGAGASFTVARLFGEGDWRTKMRALRSRALPSRTEMLPGLAPSEKVGLSALGRLYWSRWQGVWHRHGKVVWRALRRDEDTIRNLRFQNRRNDLKDWLSRPAE